MNAHPSALDLFRHYSVSTSRNLPHSNGYSYRAVRYPDAGRGGALAVKQRGAHRAHRMHARADVPHRDHREERRPVRLAAHRSNARVGGAQPVESGFARKRPCLSKGRNRAHHDARIERLDGFVVETDAPNYSRCVIFDQNIDILDEFLEDGEAFRLLRVDADAFFAAVVLNVITAATLDHDERAARGIAI